MMKTSPKLLKLPSEAPAGPEAVAGHIIVVDQIAQKAAGASVHLALWGANALSLAPAAPAADPPPQN